MKTYRLTLAPRSSFVTPLQSDTLFGHLCWAMRNRDGPERLTGFLDDFRGNSPPLLIYDALPEGRLPAPLLPPMSRQEVRNLLASAPVYLVDRQESELAALRHIVQLLKRVRKLPYVDAGLLGRQKRRFRWLEYAPSASRVEGWSGTSRDLPNLPSRTVRIPSLESTSVRPSPMASPTRIPVEASRPIRVR